MIGMGIGGLFGIVVLIVVFLFVTKGINTDKLTSNEKKSVLDILKERYVGGEINEAEFEEKKKVISQS